MRKVIVAVLLLSALSASAQKQSTAPWENGNAFLVHCDESNPQWIALHWDTANRAAQLNVCTLWLTGFRQGVELLQQLRPPKSPSAAEARANKEYAQLLEKQYGIKPNLEFDLENICIAEDVTNDQLRLVVIKWMKDNPTKLTEHGAFLAYAALQSAYACGGK